jgi:hypothetical protein
LEKAFSRFEYPNREFSELFIQNLEIEIKILCGLGVLGGEIFLI